ncbi:MBL fold metallo-hydrolase [Paracoccus marcusii]|uniref:MBL fold metallo-hydrolase n=1 Tax=Paracoccus marcusii TaxID=59779 RepID=UPI00326644BC
MNRRIGLIAGAALAVMAAPAQAQEPLFDGCPSDQIRARFAEFGETGRMPADLGAWLNDPEAQQVTPWAAFDNVDYVGVCWVSAWLVHTDEGSVLIDTLYGPFTDTLIDNVAQTGTDLADIRYVLMTHGHFDHVGGAAALKPLLPNAIFVMTQEGWAEAAEDAAASVGGPREWAMIAPELQATDGQRIELGGNTFTVLETPGHTWGTASYLFDVTDGEDAHRAITIGGLGLNAIEGPEQVQTYLDSVDRLRAMITDPQHSVEVHLPGHGFSANLPEDRERLKAREPGEPHVLVNQDGLVSQIDFLRDRAAARLAVEQGQ